jgi:hypothetical protein
MDGRLHGWIDACVCVCVCVFRRVSVSCTCVRPLRVSCVCAVYVFFCQRTSVCKLSTRVGGIYACVCCVLHVCAGVCVVSVCVYYLRVLYVCVLSSFYVRNCLVSPMWCVRGCDPRVYSCRRSSTRVVCVVLVTSVLYVCIVHV